MIKCGNLTLDHREVDLIDLETGSVLDEQGYVKETYNGEAWLGHELDESGRHTGRKIAYAGNGSQGESWYTSANTLADAMKDLELDWVSDIWVEGEMSCDPRCTKS
ncbi:MAG: hypothetical protein ACU0B9_11075 [Limimaricola soesokkakensis]|uniref:hypothetical protein n=1 Tax=Limimaricola soesokkakensis TaxID=1343159 RepID=UPI0040592353